MLCLLQHASQVHWHGYCVVKKDVCFDSLTCAASIDLPLSNSSSKIWPAAETPSAAMGSGALQKVSDASEAEISSVYAELSPEAQKSLRAALALQEARTALDGLADHTLIAEMKAIKSPPETLVTVVGAVACLLQEPNKSWTDMTKMMEKNFQKMLMDFDKDNVPPEVLAELQTYLKNPSFSRDKIRLVSLGGEYMQRWVSAINGYAMLKQTWACKQIPEAIWSFLELFWRVCEARPLLRFQTLLNSSVCIALLAWGILRICMTLHDLALWDRMSGRYCQHGFTMFQHLRPEVWKKNVCWLKQPT